ncbi:uncharacterized protein LOC111788836 isoform X4 [Cucurbita pepo subsp. pepo]|uniref:uncharacterized protein LOC111788836 isoform X3 n=1 Tax=Cucurbita pepo subsp. pepo TaxID=3664 RepID=UPI000C9D8D0A|nr:uncharacterized protein LOC111788836 isoform X3 [Cucurbita pepo subsp. pepo]XP_023525141.1 uncharacterized protein LOC111788836 isoform X4 [Cucurbita pepo subsp. pepo]
MVVVQATKLSLPNPSLSSPHITSFLFEPHSLSLALMHSDSSFSLYPSFSPFFLSSLPAPQLVVPSPSSSAAFVVLRNSDSNSDSKVLFVVSGPHQGGSRILLRFYVLETCNLFRRVRVVCTQKDLRSDDKLGVLVNLRHGLSVRLAGSVNFFAMYSISSSKIWVFAVKMVAGGDGRDDVMDLKLMRCAVIDCCKPIWSISISFGYLLLGEDNGVRVLNLRPFVRGRGRKVRNLNAKREVQKSFLPHGEVYGTSGGTDLNGGSLFVGNNGLNEHASKSDDAQSSAICNGSLDGKLDKHFDSVRARSVKLRQDSSEGGLYFVALKGRGIEDLRSAKMMPLKALSIQALSPRKILILDSVGDLHLLHLASSANGSDFSYNIRPLPHLMKVQTLTSVPDTSIRNQTVWLSDKQHSVHMMMIPDVDSDVPENRGNESEEVPMKKISDMQVIFAGEKIQDITSLSTNAVLILGQGSLYAYTIS